MKNIASRSKPSEDGAVDLSNKTIRKQEFGRRLYQQLLSQQINQSELARRSGLGRDSISQYVRGRSVPTPQNLEKIAEALQIEPDDLFPNYSAQAATIENSTNEAGGRRGVVRHHDYLFYCSVVEIIVVCRHGRRACEQSDW